MNRLARTLFAHLELGVPVNGTPPTKYSWLGAAQVSPEFASGATASHGGGYVPQLGRPLQTQPVVPPGSAPESAYVSPYVTQLSPESIAQGLAYGAEAPMREAARQKAAERETEEKACGGGMCGGLSGEPTRFDPVGCYVEVYLHEYVGLQTRKTSPYAKFECERYGHNLQIDVCVLEGSKWRECLWERVGGKIKGHLFEVNIKPGSDFTIELAGFECKAYKWYHFWIWEWEPGWRKAFIAQGPEEYCEPDVAQRVNEVSNVVGPG